MIQSNNNGIDRQPVDKMVIKGIKYGFKLAHLVALFAVVGKPRDVSLHREGYFCGTQRLREECTLCVRSAIRTFRVRPRGIRRLHPRFLRGQGSSSSIFQGPHPDPATENFPARCVPRLLHLHSSAAFLLQPAANRRAGAAAFGAAAPHLSGVLQATKAWPLRGGARGTAPQAGAERFRHHLRAELRGLERWPLSGRNDECEGPLRRLVDHHQHFIGARKRCYTASSVINIILITFCIKTSCITRCFLFISSKSQILQILI